MVGELSIPDLGKNIALSFHPFTSTQFNTFSVCLLRPSKMASTEILGNSQSLLEAGV